MAPRPRLSNRKRHPIVSDDLQRITEASLPWGALEDSTVLVTGAAGLVASYLVQALLFRNEHHNGPRIRVVAGVRNPAAARERFAAYAGRSDLDIVHHDASGEFSYRGALAYVVHAAGNATPSSFGLDPVGTYTPNVIGTHHLLQRAQTDGTR